MKKPIQKLFATPALLALFILNIQSSTAQAQGTAFAYQGHLLANGQPASGIYDLQFAIYDAATNGSVVAGPVTNSAVSVTNGLFVVQLDFGNIFEGNPRWLEIGVHTNGNGAFTTLAPRQPLLPMPYAIMAGSASNLLGSLPAAQLSGTISETALPASPNFSGAVTAASFSGNGVNITNLNAAALNGLNAADFWQLGGNNVAPGQFLGSTNNQPVEIWVNGQRVLRLEPGEWWWEGISGAPNVIGGSAINSVSNSVVGATIGGGGALDYAGYSYSNTITGDFGTIGGGYGNVAGDEATVGGGQRNTADQGGAIGGGQQNRAPGGTVGGGFRNYASGGATVGGGQDNGAEQGATVGGGEMNGASGWDATIAGGHDNTASGVGAFIGGGGTDGEFIQGNVAEAKACVIGGGLDNSILNGGNYGFIGGGEGNTASANYAAVGGGCYNVASGAGTFVAGGSNTGSGNWATVCGGVANWASGTYSFAAGFGARATNDGAFVWSDGTSTLTYSSTSNQFVARASGGFVLYTSTTNTGVTLAPGSGSWSAMSDRNAKDDFAPVDSEATLDRVASLPVTTWSYKTEPGVRHIGPMAQDFYAAFKVGEDNKHIADVDEGGVALAAIQALDRKVNAENAALRTQNARLQREVENLQHIVTQLSQKPDGDAHTTTRKRLIRTVEHL